MEEEPKDWSFSSHIGKDLRNIDLQKIIFAIFTITSIIQSAHLEELFGLVERMRN